MTEVKTIPGIPDSDIDSPVDVVRPKIHQRTIFFIGFFILALLIVVGFFMFCFWPIQIEGPDGDQAWRTEASLISINNLHPEQRMVVLVLLAGLMGSLIHAATSFANYVGEQVLDKNWLWWYALRPLIGMAVALVFYLVFRGGLVNNTKLESLNVYGVMTLAALAGLFSDRATLKLKEVFETMFQPKDDRSGKLATSDDKITGDDNAKS